MRTFKTKPTGRPRALSPEAEQHICDIARATPEFRYIDLARQLGVTDGTIRNTLRRFGIKPIKRYLRFSFTTTRFWKVKNTARKRGLDFNLTMPYLEELFTRQDGKCPYTGWALTFSKTTTTYDGTASLDRIDSTKGYVQGNVQWVHKHINLMKLAHAHEEFVELCKAVARHSGSMESNPETVERLQVKLGVCTRTWRSKNGVIAEAQNAPLPKPDRADDISLQSDDL